MTFDQLKATDYHHPTVAIFYGTVCPACDRVKPRLREVCKMMGLRLEEFNSAGELDAIRALGLRSVPAVYLVHRGVVTPVFIGLVDKEAMRGLLLAAGSGESL